MLNVGLFEKKNLRIAILFANALLMSDTDGISHIID